MGFQAWKQETNLDRAERCYRKALAARPHDQIVLRDLAAVLVALDRRGEAIRLIERVENPRHDISLWLAHSYLAAGRLDDCIGFLSSIDIKNPEGSSEPHDVWVRALMTRGKERYEAQRMKLAAADFELALTYPPNLQVGQRYQPTDAETWFWLGKTLGAISNQFLFFPSYLVCW